jgi:cytidine deaminase
VRSEPLQPHDLELVEAAKAIIGRRFRLDRHHVGCALRTKSGRVYTAVNLEANVGRVAVCAEPIAVGQAVAAGDTDLEVIVGVLHRYDESDPVEFRAGTPCGICRELLNDYMAEGYVIVPLDGDLRRVRVRDLLPERYDREVGALA